MTAYTEAGAVLADWLEEARDTFRAAGAVARRLRYGRRVDVLEARIHRLEREVDLEARLKDAGARRLGRVTADLDELVGVLAALMPHARDTELDGLLATDRRGARRRTLEQAIDLRRRTNAAKRERDLAEARRAIALMLGQADPHDADAAAFPPAGQAFDLVELEDGRVELRVPELELTLRHLPAYIAEYLSTALEDALNPYPPNV